MKWTVDQINLLVRYVAEGKSDLEIADLLSTSERTFTEHSVRGKRRRIKLDKPEAVNPVKTYEEKVQEEKLNLLTTQRKRAERHGVEEQARREALLEAIREAVTPLKFVQPKFVCPEAGGDEEELVLMLSDLHFGKKNRYYSLEIAKERFNKLIKALMVITAIHRTAYPIKKLHIFWLGDIVDGTNIYPTHVHHVEQHAVNQVVSIIPELAGQLATLAGFFSEVHNYCVRGNHGRNRKDAHEDENWDFLTYKVMEIATSHLPHMTWSVPEGWEQIVSVLNTNFLLVHGDQVKMQLNLPWYGITTRVARWATTKYFKGFDVLCMGHFHTSSRIRWNSIKIFTNGTLVEGDDFALEKLGLAMASVRSSASRGDLGL